MDQDTTVLEATAIDGAAVEEELLIEEISIDGMCGVY
jgi:mycofactocin precursor